MDRGTVRLLSPFLGGMRIACCSMPSGILELEASPNNVLVAGIEASMLDQLPESGLVVCAVAALNTATFQVVDPTIVAFVAPCNRKVGRVTNVNIPVRKNYILSSQQKQPPPRENANTILI